MSDKIGRSCSAFDSSFCDSIVSSVRPEFSKRLRTPSFSVRDSSLSFSTLLSIWDFGTPLADHLLVLDALASTGMVDALATTGMEPLAESSMYTFVYANW